MVKQTSFRLFCLISLLFLAGCVTNAPMMATSSGSAKSDIQFIDIDGFDADMKSSMSAGLSDIKVTPLATVHVNNVPPRLGRWLNAINESGGTIDVEPKSKSAISILGMILSLAQTGAALFQIEENIYQNASRYNVVIFYEPNDGKVSHFQFARR